jgi:hypothetical protein
VANSFRFHRDRIGRITGISRSWTCGAAPLFVAFAVLDALSANTNGTGHASTKMDLLGSRASAFGTAVFSCRGHESLPFAQLNSLRWRTELRTCLRT